MSSVTANVNKGDLRRLNDTIEKILHNTTKTLKDILQQTAKFALQSAAKETRPGRNSKISSLSKKYRLRPILNINSKGVFFYKYYSETQGIWKYFRTPRKIRKKYVEKKNLIEITRGIKFWNKKENKWDYIPTEYKGKYNPSDKRARIPGAGAAKAGWLAGLVKLKGRADIGKYNPNRMARVAQKYAFVSGESYIFIRNEVDYAGKISPSAPKIALDKAEGRVRGTYLKKLDKEIQKTWNRK